MAKVLCTLPNASELINGVKFAPHASGGMLSEDITDAQAEDFASIPGYELVGAPKAPATDPVADADAAKAAADAERAALVARAEAIQFKVKANWSLERLKSEVESAEAEAAKAKAAAGEQVQ